MNKLTIKSKLYAILEKTENAGKLNKIWSAWLLIVFLIGFVYGETVIHDPKNKGLSNYKRADIIYSSAKFDFLRKASRLRVA